jgi:hypothetical protein
MSKPLPDFEAIAPTPWKVEDDPEMVHVLDANGKPICTGHLIIDVPEATDRPTDEMIALMRRIRSLPDLFRVVQDTAALLPKLVVKPDLPASERSAAAAARNRLRDACLAITTDFVNPTARPHEEVRRN